MVRFVDSGDEPDAGNGDGLAPVTSIFGGSPPVAQGRYPKTADAVRQELDTRIPARPKAPREAIASHAEDSAPPSASQRRTPWHAEEGARSTHARDAGPIDLASKRADGARAGAQTPPAPSRDSAERGLLKKLRGRQLSVSEAKAYLAQHDLDAAGVESVLGAFLERGYLDDARLAELLVHSGVDRKGQGRQAIAQSMAKRGVPRDIADSALAEVPDDDAERALDFARTKAGSMRGLERDVALRRLAGQLARRGYGGSAALSAARQALDESMRGSGRVRFE